MSQDLSDKDTAAGCFVLSVAMLAGVGAAALFVVAAVVYIVRWAWVAAS